MDSWLLIVSKCHIQNSWLLTVDSLILWTLYCFQGPLNIQLTVSTTTKCMDSWLCPSITVWTVNCHQESFDSTLDCIQVSYSGKLTVSMWHCMKSLLLPRIIGKSNTIKKILSYSTSICYNFFFDFHIIVL